MEMLANDLVLLLSQTSFYFNLNTQSILESYLSIILECNDEGIC